MEKEGKKGKKREKGGKREEKEGEKEGEKRGKGVKLGSEKETFDIMFPTTRSA